ncbi:MAG: WD40 repeat domain-containing protein, partial [bacterium]|nr:WD40 repeat domain-containing protein [bacterium]
SRLHQDELTLKLPPDTLDSQLNADWTRLATHDGHTIWLWDPTTGKLLDSLPLTDGEILCFAWHPNGTQLAIGLDDTQHSVKLWGTSDDKQLEDIGRIGSPLLGLAWSPNGSRLACVGWEQATVFNFQNGDSFELEAPLRNPNHTGGPDYSVGWSPDGRKLVIAIQQRVELQRKMEVWDMETQSRDVTLDGGYCIAYSPDGQTIAGGQLHHLVLCDLTDDKTLDPLPGHARAIFDLAWNPDGTLLATGADDRTIRIWDVQRREQLRVLEGHTACVRWVEWNRQGDQIASASEDGTIKFWSVAHDGSPESIGDPLTLPGVTLVWHPSGRQLCMSDQWGRFINVWDFDKNCRLESLRTEPSRIKNVSLSPDGRYLVAYNGDGTFKIWDLEDTRTTFLLPNVRGQKFIPGVSAWAEWSPSQHRSWLATALRGGVELWDVQAVRTGGEAQPRHLRTLGDENTRNRYRTLAWSRNGKRLAAGRNQGEIEIWNLETGETKYLKGGHRRPVLKMSWSHDDKSLVTCGYENYIIVWDTGNANQRRKLEGHTNTVEWVDWSPDGKRIASAGTDTSVKVWDAESGQEMMTLLGHGCFVSCVEWSPDGMSLASSDIDGVTIIWDARKGYAYNEIELDTLGK